MKPGRDPRLVHSIHLGLAGLGPHHHSLLEKEILFMSTAATDPASIQDHKLAQTQSHSTVGLSKCSVAVKAVFLSWHRPVQPSILSLCLPKRAAQKHCCIEGTGSPWITRCLLRTCPWQHFKLVLAVTEKPSAPRLHCTSKLPSLSNPPSVRQEAVYLGIVAHSVPCPA